MTNLPSRRGWKLSRYVVDVEVPGADTLLLFAGFAGRLVEIPSSYREATYELLEAPNRVRTSQHATLHKLFREQAVIVPDGFDELEYFRQKHDQSKLVSSPALALTICPTLNCNFRCTYCYQHHPVGFMAPTIQDRIVDYVRHHRPAVKGLSVTWFGGEPLLGMAIIERLTARFKGLVDDYRASIVTNGALLVPAVSKHLVELGVISAQITLDGPRHVHDGRRPLKGGRPTFDKVLSNIRDADLRLAITIRCNVDRTNADSIPKLLDQLDEAGLRGRVSVYMAPVAPYTEVCADVKPNCMSGRSWAGLQMQLQLIAWERGYGAPSLPRARHNVCVADRAADVVIVPSGLVFKCWNDVTSPDQAVFDLASMSDNECMKSNLSRWQRWGPFNFAECETCSVLPLCMGGCPHVSMARGRGACKELKHNLSETVLLSYLDQRRGRAAQQLTERLQRWVAQVVAHSSAAAARAGKTGAQI